MDEIPSVDGRPIPAAGRGLRSRGSRKTSGLGTAGAEVSSRVPSGLCREDGRAVSDPGLTRVR